MIEELPGQERLQRAEEALRTSEAFSRAVLESFPDRIMVMDIDARILRGNAAGMRLLEIDDFAQWAGRPWVEVWSSESRGVVEEALATARAGRVARFQQRSATAKGSMRWWDCVVAPMRADGAPGAGAVTGLIAVTRDITDLKRAEEEVARADIASSRLAAIIESSDDAIVSKDLNGVIQSWNSGAQRIFGYTADEVVGRHISVLIPPERLSEEDEVLSRLRRGERIDHFETVRCAKDGRLLNISLTVSPVKDSEGRVVGASKVARDISERKRSDEERERLLASERAARADAERAGRMKDEFLATLSHELRTPLSAVLGWAGILRKKPADPDTLEQGLAVIERNARLQSQLIGDLLDMSRIISGKMRLDVQRVELPVVIEAALESVRPAADAKGIRVVTELETITERVMGDPARLQQVVWNLLSNAVKFTPSGGRVSVELRRKAGNGGASNVEIQVRDTGRGMSAEFLPRAFERFRQADSSAAREYGGLGLGLAIVKQLVELHGGGVSVASEGSGLGSTFTVQLPVAARVVERAAVSVSPQGRAGAGGLDGVRVLVVDDEADGRELVRRFLEDAGATVETAGSADEALALLDRDPMDVVVSDIGLPGRDGYAFIRALRQKGGPPGRLPAAALTAFARSEDRARALEAGFQTHIAKPYEPLELVAAVSALVRRG
ncbi:MAG TPA: PAS domain S-box protein [Phycisphaerales bacterium]|nr:PAS domain S-box protein [Phycisphaerales bacterium]